MPHRVREVQPGQESAASAQSAALATPAAPRPKVYLDGRELIVVDTGALCEAACQALCDDGDVLAVDSEGTDTCHAVRPCLLQACARTGPVYLFDIQMLGQKAFDAGLRDLLSESGPRKLFYDSRGDAEALQLFGVELGNFVDLQVAYFWAKGMRGDFVPGMSKALEDLISLPEPLRSRVLESKEVGRTLFASELGGSERIWEKRPMLQELTEYAANDVQTLFYMLDQWAWKLRANEELLRQVSRRRADLFTAGKGSNNAKRDFPSLKDFRTVYASSLKTAVRELRVYLESEFGRVVSATCASNNSLFIEFASSDQALRAIKLCHRKISVSWPRSRAKIMSNYQGLLSGLSAAPAAAPGAAVPSALSATPNAAPGAAVPSCHPTMPSAAPCAAAPCLDQPHGRHNDHHDTTESVEGGDEREGGGICSDLELAASSSEDAAAFEDAAAEVGSSHS